LTTRATDKILRNPQDLKTILPLISRPLVFTNGCFDILHRGHVDYLEQAAVFGRTLLVAVNGNDSVRRLDKGPGRPFNDLEDRMAVIAALECVNYVVPFDSDTPILLISKVRPNHLVKGGDWDTDLIVGAAEVLAGGGEVHSIPIRYPVSTSSLAVRIQELSSKK
jgi:rfaE bifunctional protein nucleotidyltransferase chain/domain